jgi:carboxylate-amine ligase
MLTVGAEEEFFIVDDQSYQLADESPRLLRCSDMQRVKPELFECIVEAVTPTIRHPRDVLYWLTEARSRTARSCHKLGLQMIAVAGYPERIGKTPRITQTPYYRDVASRLGDRAMGQLVCGLHVHIGLPSPTRIANALEGVVPWLPTILALSANSPFAEGLASPFLSTRGERLAEIVDQPLPPASLPGDAGSNPPDIGGPSWWDIRHNTRHGTLEIRLIDQPTDVRRSAAIVELVHAVATVADRQRNCPASRDSYPAARRSAAIGCWSPEPIARFVEPVARAIGTWASIDELLRSPREAEWQLRYAGEAGITELLKRLGERSVS